MSINSEGNETHLVLTADGQTMFFSSDRAQQRLEPRPGRSQHQDPLFRHLPHRTPEGQHLGGARVFEHGHSHHKVIGSDAFGQKLIVLDDDGWTQELKTTERWERGWTVAEPLYLDRTIPNKEKSCSPTKTA